MTMEPTLEKCDGLTDQLTDIAASRVAFTRLKIISLRLELSEL